MNTLICRTCGCSLVRLGIIREKSVRCRHDGEEHHFCCQPCADLFVTDPDEFLQETNDLIVCPTCLAEKPLDHAVTLKLGNDDVHFCRCPYCAELFRKNPEFYIKRLEGSILNEGVLDHDGCCLHHGSEPTLGISS